MDSKKPQKSKKFKTCNDYNIKSRKSRGSLRLPVDYCSLTLKLRADPVALVAVYSKRNKGWPASKNGQARHIDWPILLSASFSLLQRQKMTFLRFDSEGLFHYCHTAVSPVSQRSETFCGGIYPVFRADAAAFFVVWQVFPKKAGSLDRLSHDITTLYRVLRFLQNYGAVLITTETNLQYELYLTGLENRILARTARTGKRVPWEVAADAD